MAAPTTLLITGGTGFIGSALARSAQAQGHSLRLLGRRFAPVADLIAAGAEPFHADLRDRDAVIAACAGAEMVFHIGALSSPWGERADFVATNIGGTEHVLEGCRRHGVRRLVHVSSPSVVFAGVDQHDLPDSAPYPPRFASVYSETKKLAEDRVNAAFARGDVAGVIVRPKAVFGPGDTSLLPRLIAAARAGRLPRIGKGTNRVELTFIENVVAALQCAAAAPAAALGKTFTITNQERVALWETVAHVLRALEIPWRPRTLSLPVALGVARLLEWRAARVGIEPLLTRYTVQLLACEQTYDTSPSRTLLGYTPRVSVAEGLERTIAALKKESARP